jgi:hypothetical protein
VSSNHGDYLGPEHCLLAWVVDVLERVVECREDIKLC